MSVPRGRRKEPVTGTRNRVSDPWTRRIGAVTLVLAAVFIVLLLTNEGSGEVTEECRAARDNAFPITRRPDGPALEEVRRACESSNRE